MLKMKRPIANSLYRDGHFNCVRIAWFIHHRIDRTLEKRNMEQQHKHNQLEWKCNEREEERESVCARVLEHGMGNRTSASIECAFESAPIHRVPCSMGNEYDTSFTRRFLFSVGQCLNIKYIIRTSV